MRTRLSMYAFFYLFALVLMRASGIIAKFITARAITPYEYGIITLLVITLPGVFQLFTNFCFFDIMGHATEGKKYFGFSLIYGIITTLIISILIIVFHSPFFAYLNLPEENWMFYAGILIFVLFFVTVSGAVTGILRGRRNHSYAATFSASSTMFRLAFLVIGIYIVGISDFNLIVILFAIPVAMPMIPVILFKGRQVIHSLHSIAIPDKKIMYFGISAYMISAWVSFSQHMNSMVISHNLGVTWQGFFDASLSVVVVMTFLSLALYLVAIPETTDNKNKEQHLFGKGGFWELGRFLFSGSVLCIIIIGFYSTELVTFLFGDSYSPAGQYLPVLALGYGILFIQQFVAYSNLKIEDTLSKYTIITIINVLLFPVFTHFMILQFNFAGAYLSTTIFIAIFTLITIYFIEDRIPLKMLLHRADRMALSVLVPILLVGYLKPGWIWGILALTSIFYALIFLTGYLEKDFIANIFRSLGSLKGK